jgi:IclR family transcriptional regulator, pca regulon regulatory protein
MDGVAEQTAADPIDGAPAGLERPEPDDEPERKRGEYFVQSVERALAVIRTFSADRPELTLSEIARHTGMTRAAARRFVLTLADLGYLGVLDRKFYLRPTVLELGNTYLSVLSVPQAATPHLTHLSERLHETTSLAVLEGDDIVYVARIGPRRVISSGLTVGTRLPAYLTSHGRMQLACLPDEQLDDYLARVRLEPRTAQTVTDPQVLRRRLLQARAQGWCLVDQELEEGVTSIAVPVRNGAGRVVASVNVGTHSRRLKATVLREVALEPLQETAAEIERDIALLPTSARITGL